MAVNLFMDLAKADLSETLEHTEFETKYRVESHMLLDFKKTLDALPKEKSFVYVEGPDAYFIHPDHDEGSFARFRKPSYGLDNGRKEVTFKIKPKGAKNNIMRKEYNWRVDQTEDGMILEGLVSQNYKFNFSIWKTCHIYKLDDATLVFYSVYDTTEGKAAKFDNFLEIEVDEASMKDLTEAQAWSIIEKYEKILTPIGVSPQRRLRKSLFEMYRRSQ